MLAVAESYENGKPVRETLGADVPLSVDHFRHFVGAIRSEGGGSRRSTSRPTPTILTSRSAWSGRSFRSVFCW
jgi:acyl-CoA reductase-like NAD-dependent aldehyde dehydrogenase